MAMDRLPQELLRLIVEDVDYESLESLRLVNKAFAAAAAPLLFKVIPLWIGVRSLERLTAISEHPQLSQYPKQIILSPMRFIDYEVDAHYRDKVKNWLDHQPASLSMQTLTMTKHISAYRSYIKAQRLLSLKNMDVKILARAFSQLPRLESLHVDYWQTIIGSDELRHAFGVFKAEDLISNDCQYTLFTLMKALAVSSVKIKVFKLGCDDDSSYTSISRSIGDCSSAAPLARPPLPNSRVDFSFPNKISSQALSTVFCDENLKTCEDALCDMREFQLGEFSIESYDTINASKIVAALQSLLQSSRCLETVTLDQIYSNFDHLIDLRPSMDNILPYHGLEKIKKLSLHHYQTTVVSLSDFFRRHGHTIVEVRFDYVEITGGDWATALVQLRNLDFPRLETFILSHSDEVEEDYDVTWQVQDYILKKTDENPIVAWREEVKKEREQEQVAAQQQRQAAAEKQ